MEPTQTSLPKETMEYTRKDGIVALLITMVVVVVGVSVTSYKKQGASVDAEGVKIYTATELAAHNKVDDCWITIDGQVFDMTEPSKTHPGSFHCGADGSANYHKNHGPTIRSRMDPFRIGKLNPASAAQLVSSITVAAATETITPTRELF